MKPITSNWIAFEYILVLIVFVVYVINICYFIWYGLNGAFEDAVLSGIIALHLLLLFEFKLLEK